MDANFFYSEMISLYSEPYLIIPDKTYEYIITNINVNYLLIIFLYSSLLSLLYCYKRENNYRLINNSDEIIEAKIVT
tara:strand:+ start:411 stop:641 length:231 start_codon:yes stop_codon:yes gene_type:complete